MSWYDFLFLLNEKSLCFCVLMWRSLNLPFLLDHKSGDLGTPGSQYLENGPPQSVRGAPSIVINGVMGLVSYHIKWN